MRGRGSRAANASTPPVAGQCAVLTDAASTAPRGTYHLKATGLGSFLLSDSDGLLLGVKGREVERLTRAGPAAEWEITRAGGAAVRLRAAISGRFLAGGARPLALVESAADPTTRLRLRRVGSCRRFPEAELNASGTRFKGRRRDGTVLGFADAHLHITADMRAGGRVIHGKAFDRFGIAAALGGDDADHGPDGILDVTGNLLRSGLPVGTHDTEGWPSFAGWPTFDTITHQQTYYRWLQRAWLAGERLVVAQTVEDEPLCFIEPIKSQSCDETTTIELQVRRLRGLQDYVDAQRGGRGRGWLQIVENPAAARRAIERGKLAVVIGAESSNPFGCSLRRGVPACDRAGVDRGIRRLRAAGVRSLFIAHWVNNALGGTALEGGDRGLFIGVMNVMQTGGFFRTGPCPEPGQGEEVVPATPESLAPLLPLVGPLVDEPLPLYPPGRQCNSRRLTELGVYAVRRLMDAHMLIEVDHLSEAAREQVLALAEARRYPLVSSHTGTGGSWTRSELRRLRSVGGFATATIESPAALVRKLLAVQRDGGGFRAVGLGSDTGGFAELPGPDAATGRARLAYPFRSFDGRVSFDRQRTGRRTFDFNTDGVAHYGLLPDLLASVRKEPQGRKALSVLFGSAESYLRTWERTGIGNGRD